MTDSIFPSSVPLSRIKPGANPRRYFDQAKHDELVAGFRLRGMLQPILLRPDPADEGTYLLVAGGRRYRAALEVFGAEGTVPVLIREMTDQEALEGAIDENDNRDDASETEQADAAARALAAAHDDRAEAARRLGWSTAKLDRRLALANLSETVKTALDERRIKVGHAELLAAVPGDKQDKALETILTNGLDVAKTRAALTTMSQDLGGATFDKTECATCPFNTALQRALFETHVDEGHCTNPGCYELKTEGAAKSKAPDAPAAETPPPVGDDAPEPDEAAAPPEKSATSAPASPKPAVTAESVAAHASTFREATWRTAVGQALASAGGDGLTVILAAAMSGTLSQIKPESLTSRATIFMGEAFANLDFKARFAAVRGMPGQEEANALDAIAAAYARDVSRFDHVAALADIFEVDVRSCWSVDAAFLGRFTTRDELTFVAQECGLVAHMGEKAFAKLLKAKLEDIVAGMLNATGFDWAGHVPSAMSLDGTYSAPPAASPETPTAEKD